MEKFTQDFFNTYLPILLALWPVLAFIATLTPTETDNVVLAKVKKLLDLIAFNFGNAKNATKKDPLPEFKQNSRKNPRV